MNLELTNENANYIEIAGGETLSLARLPAKVGWSLLNACTKNAELSNSRN
jgi:hypothetical protein